MTVTLTVLDIFYKDLGQSWKLSMIQTLVQPLETTEIMFKHRNIHKHTRVDLKQRQGHAFIRIQDSGIKAA